MKCLPAMLLGAALCAAGYGAFRVWGEHQPGPLVITLRLQYSSPLSRQYFEQMVLYATHEASTPDSDHPIFMEPPPTLTEPERKVWTLDPATFAGFSLHLRDQRGILMPWRREVVRMEFDTLARQGRRVDLTVGGNTVVVSFRVGDQKLGEPEYWRYRLVHGYARLLQAAPAPEPWRGKGTVEGSWRLVQLAGLFNHSTCKFGLISPGDYRVELLNSSREVMLAGPLHVPGDSELIQQLEAQVERP